MPRVKRQHLKKRPDGRYCCKYKGIQFMGSSEEEALEKREAYKRKERDGLLLTPERVGVYAEPWLRREKVDVSDQTYREASVLLEKLTKSIGNKLFSEVKPSDIKEIYSTYFAGLSASYIRAASQLYKALFDAAVADGYCKSNPAREKAAAPHRGTTGGHRAITPQERRWIETLCTDHRAWPAVMVMLYAGLRPQEAKALDIDRDVDTKKETIQLHEFVHMDGLNRYSVSTKGKTDRATRTIPLLPQAKAALNGRHGLVITSANGKPVTIQAWRSAWESYVHCMETAINGCEKRWYGKTREHKQLIAEGKELPPWISFDVTPYDLRHSFCTMCRDNNVELKTCIRWMGHTDAKMILKIYDEVSEDRSEKEAEKLKKQLQSMQTGMQTKTSRPRTRINKRRTR